MGKTMAVKILGEPWVSISGCTKISAGCKHCYAERFTERFVQLGLAKYQSGFNKVVCHPYVLEKPKKKRDAETYFVNSMADTFHDDVPIDFIQDIFITMNKCRQHTFQVLTKRSKRMIDVSPFLEYTDNIWQGVSVEGADCVYRIDDLREIPARIKFVMFEPLVGSVGKLDLTDIDWAIVGGESGDGS